MTPKEKAAQQKPVAWMRRWHYTGEKEFKVRNPETGRMGIHNKFKWRSVSEHQLMDDDVPLYASQAVPS